MSAGSQGMENPNFKSRVTSLVSFLLLNRIATMGWLRLLWLYLTAVITVVSGQPIGEHPDWPRWCGKVYQPG